jgi:hypothetical protein
MAGKITTRLYTDKINVQTLDDTSIDERGLESNSWETTSSNVICHIQNLGSQENRQGRNTILTNFIISIPSNVNIEADMRLQDVVDTDIYYEIDGVRKSFTRDNRVIGITVTCHTFN